MDIESLAAHEVATAQTSPVQHNISINEVKADSSSFVWCHFICSGPA